MQMFGVGILELMVILVLGILVIGPDRVPQFAADLARWIRQARGYANHLMKDFNEVVGDLEKETGATREDWKEIASVVNRHTGDVVREVQSVATRIEAAAPNDAMLNDETPANATSGSDSVQPVEAATNGSRVSTQERRTAVPIGAAVSSNGDGNSVPPPIDPVDQAPPLEESMSSASDEEQPWYVPVRTSRRRSLD